MSSKPIVGPESELRGIETEGLIATFESRTRFTIRKSIEGAIFSIAFKYHPTLEKKRPLADSHSFLAVSPSGLSVMRI